MKDVKNMQDVYVAYATVNYHILMQWFIMQLFSAL